MYKHVMMVYDGSVLSDKALNEGIALAKGAGAKMTLIYVVTPHHLLIGGTGNAPGVKRLEREYADKLTDEARQMLDLARNRAAAAGVAVDMLLDHGTDPYEKIVEAARRLNCDVIVMATHGRRGIEALVVGSQTMKVLTHTTIPVLVVR
ncbi:MAG: universal stress protein [Betaproteobacteria bacterium]|nr:MAG: universal stress protein [Betaproteobacteria bacterium]